MACMQGWVFLFFEIKCYPWNTLWMVVHLVLFPFLFSKCKYDTVYSKYDQMLETGGFQIRFSSRKRTFLFQPSSSGAFAFSFREDNHPQHRVKYCKTWEDSITFPYLPTPSIFRCFAVSFREAISLVVETSNLEFGFNETICVQVKGGWAYFQGRLIKGILGESLWNH